MPGGPSAVADREIEHGGADGQPPERRGREAHKNEHGADDEKPQSFVHEHPVRARMRVPHAWPVEERCARTRQS